MVDKSLIALFRKPQYKSRCGKHSAAEWRSRSDILEPRFQTGGGRCRYATYQELELSQIISLLVSCLADFGFDLRLLFTPVSKTWDQSYATRVATVSSSKS